MLASRFLTENGFIFVRNIDEIQYLLDIGCKYLIVCYRFTNPWQHVIVTTFYIFTKDWHAVHPVYPCSIEEIKYLLQKVQRRINMNRCNVSNIMNEITYLNYTKSFKPMQQEI